jgi:hypothetical protein
MPLVLEQPLRVQQGQCYWLNEDEWLLFVEEPGGEARSYPCRFATGPDASLMGECEAGTSTTRENHHLNTTAAKGGDSSSGLIPLPSLYVRKPTLLRDTSTA